ncbi:hypothetical protein BX600DRAFT_506819 [Xylariales sp. PMI_506]|nr:hypothetical protein BX600DRAFT_506819 [Xylariales sp. PMI_506]
MDDEISSQPGSGAATPLQPATPDRVNQQREQTSSARSSHARDSSIHDKIQQFNNLSRFPPSNAASMSKHLERKTADNALKRAMLGREEAESEMRRYREDARLLRRQIEEGKERERRVGERLETVMENYGRAKETHAHTQALWEKEIRRARKETFKSQSSIVKLQEELKAAKSTIKSSDEILQREKERSKSREQEAFNARYQLVSLQEQLEAALEQVKVIEQERDAFKTLAHNEEVARIAAEGRLPLPKSEELDDEFASPKKSRVSLSTVQIASSAASEAEIEELTQLWQWEKQRADRALEQIDFLEAECQLRCCPCAKSRSRRSLLGSARKPRPGSLLIVDPADLAILGQKPDSPVLSPTPAEDTVIHMPGPTSPMDDVHYESRISQDADIAESRSSRRSTIFVPSEGIFRTVSQHELEAMDIVEESPSTEPPTPADPNPEPMHYSRTPSVEPPSYALLEKKRTSLLSLLNAPRQSDAHETILNIPTAPGSESSVAEEDQLEHPMAEIREGSPETRDINGMARAQSSAAFYTVTTTTSVPVRKDENVDPRAYMLSALRSQNRSPSFDINNPALTPTMTREEALAQIRERRGRTRSAAQGAMTPRKQMVTGLGERRDASAPAGRIVKHR